MLDGNSPPPPPHYCAYGSVYVSKLLSQFFPKCVHKSVLYVSICIPALKFLTTANIISIRCYSIFAKIKVEIRVAGWDRVTFAHGKELHILFPVCQEECFAWWLSWRAPNSTPWYPHIFLLNLLIDFNRYLQNVCHGAGTVSGIGHQIENRPMIPRCPREASSSKWQILSDCAINR